MEIQTHGEGCNDISPGSHNDVKKKNNNSKKTMIQQRAECATPVPQTVKGRREESKCAPMLDCITTFVTMPFRKARRPPHKRRPLPHKVKAKDNGKSDQYTSTCYMIRIPQLQN